MVTREEMLALHCECRPAFKGSDEGGWKDRPFEESTEGATCCECEEPWPCLVAQLARELELATNQAQAYAHVISARESRIADLENALLDLWEADMTMERQGYGADRQEEALAGATRVLRAEAQHIRLTSDLETSPVDAESVAWRILESKRP